MHRFVEWIGRGQVMCWLLVLAYSSVVGSADFSTPSGTGGFDAAALSAFVSDAVRRGDVPGAVVLVTAPDRVLYHEGFGTMNASGGGPLPKDAIFRIASMTKPLTSVAVMMLVEQGKLRLDDNVSRYVPAFEHPRVIARVDAAAGTYDTRPASRPITIRQLMTHTSGIGYTFSNTELALIAKMTGHSSETDLPLVHDPGEQWTYGASTKVLGDVVEHVSGEQLDAFLEHHVFQPLGMHDTWFSVPAAESIRVVAVHHRADGRIVALPNRMPLSAPPRGDGGLFSTAADYGRFMRMMLGRGEIDGVRLLKAETVREMSRDQTGDVKVRLQPAAMPELTKPFPLGAGEDVWGLGFQISAPTKPDPAARRPGSLSWAGLYNTFFWIDPHAHLGVVVLMQLLPFYDDGAIAVLQGVEKRVYQWRPREVH